MEIITAVIYRPGQRGEIIKIELRWRSCRSLSVVMFKWSASLPKTAKKPAHGYC